MFLVAVHVVSLGWSTHLLLASYLSELVHSAPPDPQQLAGRRQLAWIQPTVFRSSTHPARFVRQVKVQTWKLRRVVSGQVLADTCFQVIHANTCRVLQFWG